MGGISIQSCPYCRATSVAFTAKVSWQTSSRDRRALFTCGACCEGIIREWWGGSDPAQVGGDLDRLSIHLGGQWPKAESGAAPEDSPPSVARFFEQGTSSLEAGNFDAAGMMFRKALETSTKVLDANLAGKPLVARIDELAKEHRITPDLAKWAHEVRLGGNEAAHEDELFTLEEAQDLKNFIENFLRYAFTLPSAVKRRSAADAQEEAA